MAKIMLVPAESLPGLPVAAHVTIDDGVYGLTAEDGTERSSPRMFSVGQRTLRVSVEEPQGTELPIKLVDLVERDPKHQLITRPGARMEAKVWAAWDPGEYVPIFPSPGRYVIKARYKGPDGVAWLDAPSQEIQVRKPTGRSAEAAVLFQKHDEEYGCLFWMPMTCTNEKALTDLLLLVRDYGDTLYGKYARYLLAHQRMGEGWPRLQRDGTPTRSAATREALGLLLELAEDGPPVNVRDEIQLDLARCYMHLKDRASAKARLESLSERDLPVQLGQRLDALRRDLHRQVPGESRED